MRSQKGGKVAIEVYYFPGCPNAGATIVNLRAAVANAEIEATVSEIEVTTPEPAFPFPGSPTVVVDGLDLCTGKAPAGVDFSCRLFDVGGKRTGVLPVSYMQQRILELAGP